MARVKPFRYNVIVAGHGIGRRRAIAYKLSFERAFSTSLDFIGAVAVVTGERPQMILPLPDIGADNIRITRYTHVGHTFEIRKEPVE